MPKESTFKELYATALWCGKPGCVQPLYRVSETGARVLNSEAAHIHGRRKGSARWDPAMSEADNRAYDNLIVLCEAHATEIDKTEEHYPPDLLHEWKRAQVAAHARAATASRPLTDTEVAEVMERSSGLKDLTAAIHKVVPFNPRMRTRDEALDLAARQSYARRTRRLRPVPADRRDAVLIWMAEQDDPVITVPEGQHRVLVARMGAGKTEHAMRWWDEGLLAAQADPEVDIPIWLDARDITAGLDTAVTTSLGHDPARPCRIVIDNLDGVSTRQAARLLDQARDLVTVWPKTSVLTTSRPGVLASDDELITVEPWPVERGVDLVRVVAGDVLWQVWTSETKELLTSPLTAIAAAGRLRSGQDVRVSRLRLLADLARTIVEDQRPEQATQEIWDELARLAVRILGDPSPVTAVSFGKELMVWQLIETGLVVNDSGKLSFALPVFEQHFGAQAIRDGRVGVEVTASAASFPRWRYALASVVAASEPAEAESYALRVAQTNPAALSWMVEEISSEGGFAYGATEVTSSWSVPTSSGDHGATAVQRARWLREALQALLDGFGSCGTDLARQRDGQLVQWGVWCVDDWMFLGEARDTLPPPEVASVPPDHQKVTIASGWARWMQFQFPREDFGRWRWARRQLSGPLLNMLRRRRLPLPAESPLVRERLWVLAQRVMQITRRPWSSTIPLADLRQAVDGLMEAVEQSVHWRHQGGSEEIDSHDVRWIHAHLQCEVGDIIESPWPPPDRVKSPRRWRWDGYSPELTFDIHTRMLHDAVVGYRDLVEHNFANFGPALGLYGVLPVRVNGTVYVDEDDPRNGVLYELNPDPVGCGSQPSIHLELATRADYSDYFSSPIVRLPRGPFVRTVTGTPIPFYMPRIYGTDLLNGLSRPATNLAYEWLAADLKALEWIAETVRFYD